MHHIFVGIDPTFFGLAPYAPSVRSAIVMSGKEALLKTAPNARVCLLPIVSGFVGADTIACVLATRIYESDIRQLQLAKGAICSGIMMLKRVLGLDNDDLICGRRRGPPYSCS